MIVDLYGPRSGNLDNFLDSLNTSLENISNLTNNNIFILGDINLDMLNKTDKKVSLLKN